MTTQQKSAFIHLMLAILGGHEKLSIHEWYAYCQDYFKEDIFLFSELVKLLRDTRFITLDCDEKGIKYYYTLAE